MSDEAKVFIAFFICGAVAISSVAFNGAFKSSPEEEKMAAYKNCVNYTNTPPPSCREMVYGKETK